MRSRVNAVSPSPGDLVQRVSTRPTGCSAPRSRTSRESVWRDLISARNFSSPTALEVQDAEELGDPRAFVVAVDRMLCGEIILRIPGGLGKAVSLFAVTLAAEAKFFSGLIPFSGKRFR